MLNRRILRIKAMQAIYGFRQSQEANFNLAIDRIAERFLPDLNSMEVQDTAKLAADRETAVSLFKSQYRKQDVTSTAEISPKIREAAVDAIDYFHRQVRKDLEFTEKNMLRETEKIYDRYLLMLQLLVELSDFVEREAREKQKRQVVNPVMIFEHEMKFFKNPVIEQLRRHKAFTNEVIKRHVNWDRDQIRQWYKLLLKDEIYLQYLRLTETNREQENAIVDHILRSFILGNDNVISFFEEEDINWTENKAIVKNMAIKTIKAMIENTTEEDVELYELSSNWEDDREFFKELFKRTIENDEEYEGVIADKIRNWDIERITAIDRIILKMAISEMLNFPSIPVKVTINEYIELSKNYSTPRSRQFINGVLDVVSAELLQQGKIRKSGRGLLDNK